MLVRLLSEYPKIEAQMDLLLLLRTQKFKLGDFAQLFNTKKYKEVSRKIKDVSTLVSMSVKREFPNLKFYRISFLDNKDIKENSIWIIFIEEKIL